MKSGTAIGLCGTTLLVVAISYILLRKNPAAISIEQPHSTSPAIGIPIAAGSAVQQVPQSPNRSALVDDSSRPLAPQSPIEKTKRLLASVSSRATAIEYLQSLVDQMQVSSMSADEIPRIVILSESELSTEERALLREKQNFAKGRLVMARVDEAVEIYEIGDPIPADIIPPQVRGYLADDDIRDFQTRIEVSSLERSMALRAKSRKAKAP